MRKFCEKIETSLENPQRILVPPFGTCEETATPPLRSSAPLHMFLTPRLSPEKKLYPREAGANRHFSIEHSNLMM